LEVEENIWKEGVRENASTKDLGPYHRIKEEAYTKKGKGY